MSEKTNNKNSQEQELAKKRNIMLVGIIVFMAAIVGIWAFNMRSFVKIPAPEAKNSNDQVRWDDISQKFNATMGDISKKIDEITTKREEDKEVDALGNRLKNLADNLEIQYGSASSTATSTATTTATSTESAEETVIRDNLKQLEDKLNKLN